MVSNLSITFSAKVAWWVKPMIYSLIAVCVLIDLAPDEDHVAAWIAKHGVKLTVAR